MKHPAIDMTPWWAWKRLSHAGSAVLFATLVLSGCGVLTVDKPSVPPQPVSDITALYFSPDSVGLIYHYADSSQFSREWNAYDVQIEGADDQCLVNGIQVSAIKCSNTQFDDQHHPRPALPSFFVITDSVISNYLSSDFQGNLSEQWIDLKSPIGLNNSWTFGYRRNDIQDPHDSLPPDTTIVSAQVTFFGATAVLDSVTYQNVTEVTFNEVDTLYQRDFQGKPINKTVNSSSSVKWFAQKVGLIRWVVYDNMHNVESELRLKSISR